MQRPPRPELDRYDDSLFLTLRTLWYVDENDAVETGEISMFVGTTTWSPCATARDPRCTRAGWTSGTDQAS